jgi:two-component system sensor histidine kinase PhcS
MLEPTVNQPGNERILQAFAENERAVRIQNYHAACILAFIFMPAGMTLDLMVYPDYWKLFLGLRLICSALLLFIWWFVRTPLGARNYETLGLILPALPSFFISVMIYLTEGAQSPYYAGLYLVLLGAGLVLRWTFRDTIIVFTQTSLLYVGACLLHYWVPPASLVPNRGVSFNNFYFLFVSGTFVMVGIYFYNRLRFKEFALRFELDVNRRELEESNRQLSTKQEELESSNQQLSQKKSELEKTLVELRQTQDQLITKEKQASLGVWSAGIIHEMNNPLNFARTGLYALRNKGKHLPETERPEFDEIIGDIEDGVKRVHTIVSDLRTYAHPGLDTSEEVSVSDVTRVALRFFAGDLQGFAEIVQNIPSEQTVHGNKNKLIQVLANMLQNSLDALKAKSFNQDHPTITITGKVENGRSQIILRDNGTGIKPENLDKIFDPFFTTKDVGQGMGLGLGICYRIVQEFGGTIAVKTEVGQFCEFTLDFPQDRPEADTN